MADIPDFHVEFVESEDSSDSGLGENLVLESLEIYADSEAQSLSDIEIEEERRRYRLGERDGVRVWHYNGLVLHYVGRQWIVADDYANYDYLYAIYGVDHDLETEEEEEEWTEEEESDEEEEESCECRGACNCRK